MDGFVILNQVPLRCENSMQASRDSSPWFYGKVEYDVHVLFSTVLLMLCSLLLSTLGPYMLLLKVYPWRIFNVGVCVGQDLNIHKSVFLLYYFILVLSCFFLSMGDPDYLLDNINRPWRPQSLSEFGCLEIWNPQTLTVY